MQRMQCGLLGLTLLLFAGPAAAMDQSATEETNCLMACDANQENCLATGHSSAGKHRPHVEIPPQETRLSRRLRTAHRRKSGCVSYWGETTMNFQRITIGLIVLLIAGLAGSFYMNWKTLRLLQTTKAFVESAVFAEAVAACEKAQSTTPFKWNGGKQTAVIGLTSVKLNKDTIIASYTLFADGVYCDFNPIKRTAEIGSNFLERD